MEKDRNKYTRHDLLEDLNRLKKEEFGENFVPITLEQIYLYCNPKNKEIRRYKTFEIKKKSGGKRAISAPYRTLHSIQTALNAFFKEIYTPNKCAMGFVTGRSVVDNAKVHVGHNYVLNMDLKNFFPSICEARVIARLQLPPFNFNKDIAQVIGGLCAIRIEDENGNENFVLPQGAPTSPILTNAICDSLDKKLNRLAYKNGLHYTRYADDMTFSSMHNIFKKDPKFMSQLRKTIEDEGFTINETKTRIQKRGTRQEVTGLTVNDKANVAKQYIHDVRCILHIWEKYGYADAYARFYPKYKLEKGYIKKGEPVLENVIEGKLNYLKMVKGEDDPVFKKLQSRYMDRQPCVYCDKETDKGNKYIFVQSYTVHEFEEHFDTQITWKISEKGTVIGHCQMFGKDKFLSIRKKDQDWLKNSGFIKTADDETMYIDNPEMDLCYITLCRQKSKNFWLVTRNKPKKNTVVKLNYTNIPIDKLINVWREKGIEEAADMFHEYCIGNLIEDKKETKKKELSTKKQKGASLKKAKKTLSTIPFEQLDYLDDIEAQLASIDFDSFKDDIENKIGSIDLDLIDNYDPDDIN